MDDTGKGNNKVARISKCRAYSSPAKDKEPVLYRNSVHCSNGSVIAPCYFAEPLFFILPFIWNLESGCHAMALGIQCEILLESADQDRHLLVRQLEELGHW